VPEGGFIYEPETGETRSGSGKKEVREHFQDRAVPYESIVVPMTSVFDTSVEHDFETVKKFAF
jgi:hypothetical protein